MNTYCGGFKLRPQKDITYGDLIAICRSLNEKFNNEFSFAPEPISDGFIYFKNLNANAMNGPYKCMRIGNNRIKWIGNMDTIFDEWENSNEIFIKKNKRFDNSTVYGTELKAFSGAPGWTLDELKKFKEVFQEFDIKVSKFPPAFHLNYKKYRKKYSFPWEK